MGFLSFLISNPVSETSLMVVIRISAWVMRSLIAALGILPGFSLERFTIRLMKLPLVREMTVRAMLMLRPMMNGIEPEGIYVFREILRVRGVKEIILPMVMSTGVLIEHLTAAEVMNKLGEKKEKTSNVRLHG